MTMMRVSEERQAARIRITKATLAVHEAMDSIPGITEAEKLMAVLELAKLYQNNVILETYPLEQT